LSHPANTFCFSYFSGRVAHFCQGLAPDLDCPTSASGVAGMAGGHHHHGCHLCRKHCLLESP
jgi:hypothetical protein